MEGYILRQCDGYIVIYHNTDPRRALWEVSTVVEALDWIQRDIAFWKGARNGTL